MQQGRHSTSRRGMAAGLVCALLLPCAVSAQTAPTASGHAWSIAANVSLLGAQVINLDAQNQVGFDDQTLAYRDTDAAASLDTGANLLARIQTGAIATATDWVTGPAFVAAGSEARVDNLTVSAVNAVGASLLSLGADVIDATALVSGTCPQPAAQRVASLAPLAADLVFRNGFELENLTDTSAAQTPGLGATGSLLNAPLVNVPVKPQPNTSLDLGVVTIILNERTTTGDGITSRGVAVNGLHIKLNALGVLTGDITVSHADAAITCH